MIAALIDVFEEVFSGLQVFMVLAVSALLLLAALPLAPFAVLALFEWWRAHPAPTLDEPFVRAAT